MTGVETSPESENEPPTDQSERTSEEVLEDYVTETTTKEKKFSVSINHNTNPLFPLFASQNEDADLGTVADSFRDVSEWVSKVNKDGWDLEKFTLKTTVVVQKTEENEDG